MGILAGVSGPKLKITKEAHSLKTNGHTALVFMYSWSSLTISSVGASRTRYAKTQFGEWRDSPSLEIEGHQ